MSDSDKTANILKLLQLLRFRLNSSSKQKTTLPFGNTEYSDTEIYSTEMLVSFLEMSLCDFNMVPHFTFYSFEDTEIIDYFSSLLVEGAVIYALGSQALIECGREYTSFSTTGIPLAPRNVSDILQAQYSQLYESHLG